MRADEDSDFPAQRSQVFAAFVAGIGDDVDDAIVYGQRAVSVFTAVAASRYVLRSRSIALAAWAWRIPPYAIGTVATFWVIDRTSLFVR